MGTHAEQFPDNCLMFKNKMCIFERTVQCFQKISLFFILEVKKNFFSKIMVIKVKLLKISYFFTTNTMVFEKSSAFGSYIKNEGLVT